MLGQHNHELLAELGLTASEIAELEADGIIGCAPGSLVTPPVAGLVLERLVDAIESPAD